MKKLLIILTAITLMGFGCEKKEQTIFVKDKCYWLGSECGKEQPLLQVVKNLSDDKFNRDQESIIKIPAKNKGYWCGTNRDQCYREASIQEAVQLLIDYQQLKYIPAETTEKPARLSK